MTVAGAGNFTDGGFALVRRGFLLLRRATGAAGSSKARTQEKGSYQQGGNLSHWRRFLQIYGSLPVCRSPAAGLV